MESPDLYHLREYPWDLYVTLTLAGGNVHKRPDELRACVISWHRRIAQVVFKLPKRQIVYYCAREHGEMGGREHYHSCIGGLLNGQAHQIGMRMRSKNFWKLGIAEVRAYQPELCGIDYIIPDAWLSGANKFETAKMCDDPYTTIISPSFYEQLAKIRGVLPFKPFGHIETNVTGRPLAFSDSLKHRFATWQRRGVPLSGQKD